MFYTQIWMDADSIAKLDKISRVLGTDTDDAIEILIAEAYPLYEGRADDDGTIDPVGVVI